MCVSYFLRICHLIWAHTCNVVSLIMHLQMGRWHYFLMRQAHIKIHCFILTNIVFKAWRIINLCYLDLHCFQCFFCFDFVFLCSTLMPLFMFTPGVLLCNGWICLLLVQFSFTHSLPSLQIHKFKVYSVYMSNIFLSFFLILPSFFSRFKVELCAIADCCLLTVWPFMALHQSQQQIVLKPGTTLYTHTYTICIMYYV